MAPPHRLYAPEGWPGTTPPDSDSIADLPITSPFCVNFECKAFTEGYLADDRKTPLLGILNYSFGTVGFYSFWLLLFTFIHVYHRISDRRTAPRQSSQPPSFGDRLLALLRSFTYRRPNNRVSRALGLDQVSYGTLSLLALGATFIIILPWPAGRLLRVRFRFGSPPVSVRCAMIMTAFTPLTISLAGKVNIVTWCTGIGYEKLNIWHRAIGYALFGLATVHTIPHLYAPVKDGGWSMLNKLYENKARELSGTVLYAVIFGLTFASLPVIRRRVYEAFKYFHVFLGVTYVAVFFWHVHGNLIPGYIYATVAILVSSNIIRFLHQHPNIRSLDTLAGFPTTTTQLPGQTTRVSVTVPKTFTWRPGQHAFIRIPRLGLLQSHPFSISNIPVPDGDGTSQEMVFLIRKCKGFTKRLSDNHEEKNFHSSRSNSEATILNLSARSSYSEKPTSHSHKDSLPTTILSEKPPLFSQDSTPSPLRTIIDGPYGTYHRPHHLIYETVVCIAGGSGITASLPHILSLTSHLSHPRFTTKSIHLVWLIRDTSWLSWIEPDLVAAMRNVQGTDCALSVDVYVTRRAEALDTSASANTSANPSPWPSPCPSPNPEKSGISPPSMILPLSLMEAEFSSQSVGGEGRQQSGAFLLPEPPRPVMRRQGGESDAFASQRGRGDCEEGGETFGMKVHYGRPVMKDVVERCVGTGGERAVVMGCGPPALSTEVANTVAGLQGRVRGGGMREVKLELETFGW